MFYYKIIDNENGLELTSNFPKELRNVPLDSWSLKNTVLVCNQLGKRRRQLKINLEKYTLYLSAVDSSFSNKKFAIYCESCIFFAENVFPKYLKSIESEQKRFRRLRHNLISLSTSITNELYQIVPQDSLTKGGKNQISLLSDIISTDIRGVAGHLLKILKASTLMKSEFDVYDMLYSPNPTLDFFNHKIHKVLSLSLNAFWLDLLSNEIRINIEENHQYVYIDYNSISVVFSHIFDNMIKYCYPSSSVDVSFSEYGEYLKITFEMLSLRIEEEDMQNIVLEGNSGYWADKSDLLGDGLGMYIIDKLIKLNGGELSIYNNVDSTRSKMKGAIPYDINQIQLKLRKAVTNM